MRNRRILLIAYETYFGEGSSNIENNQIVSFIIWWVHLVNIYKIINTKLGIFNRRIIEYTK